MPLSVRDEQAHQVARELARLSGRSITGVVTDALEEILGYDGHGLPHSADAPGIS